MNLARGLRAAYLRSRVRDVLPDSLKVALRRRWVRLARRVGYPISSQRLPRPPLVAARRELRLTRALVACDLNRDYLDFWPLVSRAWHEIVGLAPILVLVAPAAEVPAELRDDERVRVFTPVEGIHTAFQAQCLRLLYPALLDGDGAIVISDMELMPLSPAYFHGSVAKLDARFFVAYRDVLLPRGEMAIAYNAAEPDTWRDLTGVRTEEDARARLRNWHEGTGYEGIRGGTGWYTDQHVLHRLLTGWEARDRRLWVLDDDYTGHRRLERATLVREQSLVPKRRRELLRDHYADFNAAVPYARYAAVNEAVVSLAITARGRS